MYKILLVLFSIANTALGQNVLTNNAFPKVNINIKLKANSFTTSDSISFEITYKNNTTKSQPIILSNKYPELRTIPLTGRVEDSKGKSVVKFQRMAISSTLYTMNELEEKGYLYNLKPGETYRETININSIIVFETSNYKLKKGRYLMTVSYYQNTSNKVIFVLN